MREYDVHFILPRVFEGITAYSYKRFYHFSCVLCMCNVHARAMILRRCSSFRVYLLKSILKKINNKIS